MNSFISSFRPLLVAIAIVIAIEGTIAVIVKPDIVERSNYLNWTYGQPDPFHRFTTYAKMREMLSSDLDIVQVGDSSGFHGIRPDLVTGEIGDIRYFNLSTVANTGFDGYYDFLQFALDHNPKVRAIVLYLSLRFLPKPGMIGGDAQLGAAKIHEAYVGPWSIIAFPSIALRPVATDDLYTLFGLIAPRRTGLNDGGDARNMMQSVKQEHGWWAEHDSRMIGDRKEQFFRNLCGASDTADVSIESLSTPEGEFMPPVIFDKFAALAKAHGKKLIIVFHPNACSHLDDRVRRALDTSLAMLKQKYSNLFVYPEGLFEHWPYEVFSQREHLYVGYERFSSHRLARFISAALGLPPKVAEDLPLPRASLLRPGERPVWQNGTTEDEWHFEGLVASPPSGLDWRVIETEQNERHYFETRISGLEPDRYYLVAVSYKPIGDRVISVVLREAGHEGSVWCDPKGLDAGRRADFYDGSMIMNADDSIVCWGIIKLTQDQANLGIDLLPQEGSFPYQGDGRSGLLLRNISLYMRSSPDVVVGTDEVGR